MKKRDVILNTEAHRDAFNEFAERFRAIENREHWRGSEIVGRWLDAAFRAIRGSFLTGQSFEENEAEYMRIVKQCQQPKETMHDLSAMLGIATLALQKAPIDFVGPVFSALCSAKELGQFFTPYNVSRMMAEMIIPQPGDELQKMLDDKGYISLCEPACGVGGMILATNEVLRERGLDVAKQVHWHATDIDFRAMCGAYLQCALTDCSAIITQGNTLSLEHWITTATPAALLYQKRDPNNAAAVPALPAPEQKPEPAADKRGQYQLALDPPHKKAA